MLLVMGFKGLTLIFKKVGQRSRGQMHIEEVHPLKHLTKYESNPLKDKENRAI